MDVRIISKEVDFDVQLYITNFKEPLLGLADIVSSSITMNINKKNSSIQHNVLNADHDFHEDINIEACRPRTPTLPSAR